VAERDPEGQARIAVFLQGLKQLGWTDGRNVRIDYRWGAKNSGEIKRNFGSTNRNISLMIGLASPYTVHRRARLRCAEINPNPCNGPSRKATGGR
jgi:hypothetical protein